MMACAGRHGRMRYVALSVVVVALVMAFALTVAPTPAYADGVFTFSGHGPAGPGGTSTAWSVPIQVYADSTANFDPADSYYQVLLDGVVQTRYVEQLGHWEDDGCETWWVVDDPTIARVSTPALTLTDGPHTVTVRFRDTLGRVDETTWAFTVAFTPVFGEIAPAVATSSTRPRITAYAQDNGPDVLAMSMLLDGAPVSPTWDAVAKEVAYTPPVALSTAGSHTVSITVTDAGGLSATRSWSFTISTAAAATFSSLAPSPGTTLATGTYTWRATATSPASLVRASTKAWLDGVRTPYSISQLIATQLVMNYTLYNLVDGPHSLRVRVVDVNGVETDYTWSFTVAVPPAISGQTPAPGASVPIPAPQIGFTMSDNMPGPLHALMKVDGVTVVDADYPQGQVWWQPSAPFADPSTHNVQVTVTDARGTPRTASWSFTTASLPPMSTSRDCASCHNANAHPFSNCTACHKNYPGYDEHYANPDAPLGECWGCHGQGVHTGAYISNCLYCHENTTYEWPLIPSGHASAAMETAHTSSTTGCEECHARSLLAEHGKYPADSTFKYQCVLCHASSDARVQAAIAGNVTDCWACHALAGHESAHESPWAVTNGCVECHSANLMTEHVTNHGLSCDVCHAVSAPAPAPAPATLLSLQRWVVDPVAKTKTGAPAVPKATGGISLAYTGMTDEDIWEAMASGDTSCLACHTAYHQYVLSEEAANADYSGYLSWGYVSALDPANGTTPHGGYVTTTTKCAVCHAVHRAPTTGRVLTAWPGSSGVADSPMYPYQSCVWCHATSSPLFASSQISLGSELSPHGYCGRCHLQSVHGAGGSAYPVLRARLLDAAADAAIAAEIAAGTNSIATVDFSDATDVGSLALGTGYLCGSCHTGDVAFPVNAPGSTPYQNGAAVTTVTGHRVLAPVTGTWNAAGEFGVYYSDAGAAQVAFDPVAGCTSCHDARTATGAYAFPHSYVDSAGAPVTTADPGASYIWLTVAADADDPRVVAGKTQPGSGDIVGYRDGVCLKCHVSADRASGVGVTY